MRKIFQTITVLCAVLTMIPVYSQINSGDPVIPFGSNTSYNYGIMPTNLPTSGTYGESQAAADAYNYWKSAFVSSCTDKGYRVLYDDYSSTVSEGIAYGMLLSAYAGDKDLFDGLWEFYSESENSNGVMNWKYSDCSNISGYNGATDAELDAAMALIIASYQWPTSTDPYIYEEEALILIDSIRTHEIDNTTYQTLHGDGWDKSSTCRNPGYFAPAYYREFAKLATNYTTFWTNTANTAEDFLYTNRNSTTGLVCNWADDNGNSNDCNNTSNLGITDEYGFDACRNPWRMATDVLWNGASEADVANDICEKVAAWISGYEASLKGPLAQTAGNPGVGLYQNGAFSTFALTAMVNSDFQASLNSCYTNISGYSNNESYFNQTIKTISLFMLTGNFWAPGASATAPEFVSATTDADGTMITLTLNKALETPASSDYSAFTLAINGTNISDAFSAIALNGTKALNLTVSSDVTIESGDVLTISYTPGNIQSTASVALEAFSEKSVTNQLGNVTIIADCEDGSQTKLLTEWYSYNDDSEGGESTVTPLTDGTTLFTMTAGGANGTDSAAMISFSLSAGSLSYNPFVGLGFTLTEDESAYDLEGSTGISFYHKGESANLQAVLSTNTNANYYSVSVESHSVWTLVTLEWDDFAQADWGESTQAVTWDASKITKFQWQVQDTDGSSGEVWIDEVQIDGISLNLPEETDEVDKTALEAALNTANSIADTARTGTTAGKYPEEALAEFESAITTGQNVYDNEDATEAEVAQAVKDLEEAIAIFKASVISETTFDVSELTEEISKADSILSAAVAGDENGNYPQSALDSLEAAIDSARVIEQSPESESEVAQAVQDLASAIESFENAVIVTSGLDEAAISLNVYPNPVNDVLVIELEGLQKVTIATISGQILMVTTDSVIDVSGFESGLYTVSVVTGKGTVSTMIVK